MKRIVIGLKRIRKSYNNITSNNNQVILIKYD